MPVAQPTGHIRPARVRVRSSTMARVVQRQAPPYLMILFVALFLLATAGMVFFWVRNVQLSNRIGQLESTYRQVISTPELSQPSPQLRELLTRYDSPPAGRTSQTVFAQMSDQIDELTQHITGQRIGFDQARLAVAEVSQQVELVPGTGLVPQLRQFYDSLRQAREQIARQGESMDSLRKSLEQANQTISALNQDTDAKLQQLNKQNLDLEQQIKQLNQRHTDQLQQAQLELSQVRSSLNNTISNQISQIQQLERANSDKDATINRLRDELEQKRGPAGGAAAATRKTDGAVLEVRERDGICYINIGARSKVIAGLHFTVFPPTGIDEQEQGKGQIQVTRVMDTISECRILDQLPGNPIIPGDLVTNLAFNPQRTYTFVLGGEFDLRKTGHPSQADLEEVRLLIRRAGAKIDDEVSIGTDFVILGDEPTRPVRPSEAAPAVVWASYGAQMDRYQRYHEIREAAQQLHVPILNTNRFLAFVGYVLPKQQ